MQANGVGRPKDGWQPAVEIIDAASGKVIARLELTTAEEDAVLADPVRMINYFEVAALAFSPDGNTLAVGTGIGQIKLYDAKDGKFLSSLDDSQGKAADARTPENWKASPRAWEAWRRSRFRPTGICWRHAANRSTMFPIALAASTDWDSNPRGQVD